MSQPYDVVGYTFQAATFCPRCIVPIVEGSIDYPPVASVSGLSAEGGLGLLAKALHLNRMDESSYDSGDFPKVIFRDQLDDTEMALNTCDVCEVILGTVAGD